MSRFARRLQNAAAGFFAGDTFTLGTTEPQGGINVGAGVARAYPTQTISVSGLVSLSGSTYTISAGATISDVIIPGFVNLNDGSVLENCVVTAPPTEQATSRPIVKGPTGGTTNLAHIRFCTIDPDVASAWYDGFGYTNLHVERTWVKNTTDGVAAFDNFGNGGCNLLIEGCHIESLAQFAPDYAYTGGRLETHNDCAQMQGNGGGNVNDIYIDGCKFDGRHSTTKGDIPPYRLQIAALMLTPNVSAISMTYTRGWLLGGIYCVNAGSDTLSASELVITNNRFERPGTDPEAPSVALAVDSGLTLTATGNTYIDNGQAVPATNA
jgi:hypothetical protein